MKLPIVSYKQETYHAGYMEGKPWPTNSMEGLLLSCSPCPYEWQEIAQLGECDIWTVSPDRPLRLWNFRKLKGKSKQEWIIAAQDARLITPCDTFRYTIMDEDEECYAYAQTRQAALNEGADPKEIRKEVGWKSNPALSQYWYGKKTRIDQFHVLDAAFTCIAVDLDPTVDGVLWDDIFDPSGLSAPRIGIYPKRLAKIDANKKEIHLK
jgi:hypothetical protein